jgi:predicted GIY-YIG superfamily endonuclease
MTWREERQALAAEWFAAARQGIAETYVYRYFDAAGNLLYVGQSAHVETRDRNHRNGKLWYPLVAHRTLEGPYTKDMALAAEFLALQTEDPIHNRTRANGYRGPDSLSWHLAESAAYALRCEADPDFHRREMLDVTDAALAGFAAMRRAS